MENMYSIELTGKQLCLLMNCIDERMNSNLIITTHTGKSKNSENRTLRALHRYLKNIKSPEKSKRKDDGTL